MKCIDVLKYVVMYFGAYAYYDEYSKSININIIDKINKSDALDWSDYLNSFDIVYDSKQSENNYFRFEKPTQPTLKNYNDRYLVGYGEANFSTDNDINKNNELYTAPFQASEARVTIKYGQLLMPYIGLVELEDDGDPFEYTTVTDASGVAQFNGGWRSLTG